MLPLPDCAAQSFGAADRTIHASSPIHSPRIAPLPAGCCGRRLGPPDPPAAGRYQDQSPPPPPQPPQPPPESPPESLPESLLSDDDEDEEVSLLADVDAGWR
jgi:hypothetical protein